MRCSVVVLLWFAATFALAQESALQADFRRERERMADACGTFSFKAVPGCAIELFTDHPLAHRGGKHASAERIRSWAQRSLPQEHQELATELGCGRGRRLQRGVASGRVHEDDPHADEPVRVIKPVIPQPGELPEAKTPAKKPQINLVHPYTVFNLYAQSISLNKLNFFGLGNDSTLAGASVFGMSQTIVGGSVIKPVYEWSAIRKLNLALLGEMNGRFVNIRGENGQSVPSIETLYTNATAPGLSSQPGFVQFREGFASSRCSGTTFN